MDSDILEINSDNISSIENNTWYKLILSGELPEPRVGHTAVYDETRQRVILIGGATPQTLYSDVWAVCLRSLTCEQMPMQGDFAARYEHCALMSLENASNVWVFAGADMKNNKNDLWELDTETRQWLRVDHTGDTPSPRTYHTTSSVMDGKLMVFSGGDKKVDAISDKHLYQLDTLSKKWSIIPTKGQIPAPRQGHVIISVDDKLFCHGGMSGVQLFGDLHVLDSAGLWSKIECFQQPSKRAAHGAVHYNKFIYLFGGLGDSGALNDIWRLNVDTLMWEEVAVKGTPPPRRLDFCFVLVNLPPFTTPCILLQGGMDETGQIFNDFHILKLED